MSAGDGDGYVCPCMWGCVYTGLGSVSIFLTFCVCLSVCLCRESRCALLRVPDGCNRISLSLVSPSHHSEGDLDLAVALEEELLHDHLDEDGTVESIADRDSGSTFEQRYSDGGVAVAGGGSGGRGGGGRHLSHSTSGGAGVSSSLSGDQADDMRVLLSVERTVVNLVKKITSHSSSSSGSGTGGGGGGNDVAVAETNMWMIMSTLRDITVLIRCVFLIDKCELEMYFSTLKGGGSTSTIPGTQKGAPQDASRLISTKLTSCSFSLQFHRNICRLLEEVHASTTHMQAGGWGYGRYVGWRSRLVRAYEGLRECNAQVCIECATVCVCMYVCLLCVYVCMYVYCYMYLVIYWAWSNYIQNSVREG